MAFLCPPLPSSLFSPFHSRSASGHLQQARCHLFYSLGILLPHPNAFLPNCFSHHPVSSTGDSSQHCSQVCALFLWSPSWALRTPPCPSPAHPPRFLLIQCSSSPLISMMRLMAALLVKYFCTISRSPVNSAFWTSRSRHSSGSKRLSRHPWRTGHRLCSLRWYRDLGCRESFCGSSCSSSSCSKRCAVELKGKLQSITGNKQHEPERRSKRAAAGKGLLSKAVSSAGCAWVPAAQRLAGFKHNLTHQV